MTDRSFETAVAGPIIRKLADSPRVTRCESKKWMKSGYDRVGLPKKILDL